MKAKQERIQQILSETILALCNNGLEFDCELEVDGLLGITLDKKDVFLVKISEVIQGAKTSLNIGSKHNYLGSPSELAVEDDGTDNGNVHATKRLCTQFRSPKRKKPEDDDEASPQDLSQRTHSPFGVKQELLSNADSNSRGSPATVVRLSSPSFGNNSHWKQPTDRSANTDEDAPQPLVFPRKHSPLLHSLKPIGVLSPLPAHHSDVRSAMRSARVQSPPARSFLHPLPPTPPPHHISAPPSVGAANYLHMPQAQRGFNSSASATSTRRRHKSSPDCLPSSSSSHLYAAKLDVNFRRETAKKVLTRAEEKFLVDWVFEKSLTKDGITVKKVLEEVKSWLDAECRDTNFEDNMPNEEWFREFLRRHPELYAIKWWD